MEVRFEGVVAFPSKPGLSYRCKIMRWNEDRIKFWLEDRETSNPSSDCERNFLPGGDGDDSLRLEFTVALQVYLAVKCTPKICVDLKPIPLEPIQIAEAKIRDQREELAMLHQQLALCEKARERAREGRETTRAFLLKCEGDLFRGKTTYHLRWRERSKDCASSDRFTLQWDGSVLFRSPGSYELFLMIGHQQQSKRDGIFAVTQFRDLDTTTKK